MPPAGRRRRRAVASDDDSASDDEQPQAPLNTRREAEISQIKIMTEDLSTWTRDKMTAHDAGPKARLVNLAALNRARECNLEGSEANNRAMENKEALKGWSTYGETDDAKAAGGEALPDMAAGNSHRDRVKRELREQGLTSLEDTYDEHRPRGYPPAFRNHAGATAAMANDRGRYGHARGGGNAGRGMSRVASMTARPTGRPLDPAVDPDRPYVLKSKGPKKKAAMEAKMVQGTVVVKATDKAQVSKKKPGVHSSPRLDRGPLPEHVRQSLDDSATFEQAILAMFKNKVESGKHIIAEKRSETASAAPAKVQPTSSTEGGSVRSEHSMQDALEGLVKPSLEVQHIDREELGVMKKSPDAFTDGNASTPNLSGFTPSLPSQDEALTAGNSLAGLGIKGAVVQDDVRSSVESVTDLMDTDVPGAKNASLTSPLRARPRGQSFGTKEQYEEYKTLKEFQTFVESRPSQDFTQWLNERKSDKPAGQSGSTHSSKQHERAPIDLSNGYTIGATQLGGILGDTKNIAAPTKPAHAQTQTTPGLAQSKWASTQVKGLSGFKQSSGKRAHRNPPEPASILDRTKAKLETVEEMSATMKTSQSAGSQATAVNGKTSFSEQPAAMKDKSEIQLHSQKQPEPVMAIESHTGSFATLELGNTQEDEARAARAKPVNPFAPRESTGDLATELTQDQPLGMAAKSKNSSSGKPRVPVAEKVEQPAQKQSNASQPALVKKGLSGSKWSTDLPIPLLATVTSPQTVGATKSNFKAGSIFGDSKNVQRLGSILGSIPVNTLAKTSKSNVLQAVQRSEALVPSQKSLPNPLASPGAQTSLQQPRDTIPEAPIIPSSMKVEPSSIIGDTKNVQKSASKWGRDPASQSALGIERKLTGIKRSQAGPGYDWLMREQKAKEQEKLEAENKADPSESVGNVVDLANLLRNLYVSADDTDEEL